MSSDIGRKKWYSFYLLLLAYLHLKPSLRAVTKLHSPLGKALSEELTDGKNLSATEWAIVGVGVAPADAEWREMNWLHRTLSKVQIHEQKK